MKRLLSALLTMAMLLGLCACGGPKYDESLLGTYTCYAVEMLGVEMEADEVLSQAATLELKQGGKGKMNIEGSSGSIKYTLDGENITVDVSGETATGTLKDGVLHIEIMSMNMYFIQEGKDVPAMTAPEVGYFIVETLEEGGEVITKEDLVNAGMDVTQFYLVLEEDGSGWLAIPDEEPSFLTWANGKITADGESISYTIEGDTLTLTEDDTKLVFTRSSSTPPAKPAQTSQTNAEAPGEPTALDGDGMTNMGEMEPLSADLGDYHLSILGAEQFVDSDDKDSIRFYFDFTNNSDEAESFYFACNTEAYQEGYELVETYSYFDEVPEEGNYSLDILPGTTIRCVCEYNFKPAGGEVEFTITEGYDGDSLTLTLDPAALPGRPAEDFTIQPKDSDALVESFPSEGVCGEDYYVSLTKSEVVDSDEDGEKAIRVYLDFTNNSEEVNSFSNLFSLVAMQDGIQLTTTWADDSVPEEDNLFSDVQPGETITIAKCYGLHDTGSSVAVQVVDYQSGNHLGTAFNVK